VSALVCARIFLKPLIFALLGLPAGNDVVQARLGSALPANDLRQDYLRADVSRNSDGTLIATPFQIQDSSMQRALTEAHGLIVRPPHAPKAEKGDPVDVILMDF
jgi:molybdopterin molybdotransferase